MADRGVDLSALPKEVRDQLAELDLELSEGWWMKPIPADLRQEAECTLNWLPALRKAQIHVTLTPSDNSESTDEARNIFLEFGREPQYR